MWRRRRRYLTPEEFYRRQKIKRIIIHIVGSLAIMLASFFLFMALRI